MSAPLGAKIRIICDKVAAHKGQKIQHIANLVRGEEGWGIEPPAKPSAVEVRRVTSTKPNPNAPGELVVVHGIRWRFRCPRDRCKSFDVRMRVGRHDESLDRHAETGAPLTLDELGAIVSSTG